MKVLLVEADPELAALLAHALRRAGHTVVAAVDGEQALRCWASERPGLVLVNVRLPKLDGVSVCRRIRREAETPIILLSARGADDDVVRGLQAGADDYLTEPLSTKQLTARMGAVLRRCRAAPGREAAGTVRVGDLVLDRQVYQVTTAGTRVQLTRLEFRLLWLLALNAGRAVPSAGLVDYAWGGDGEGRSSRLRGHLTHLRQKLRLPPGAIVAVRGTGYRLTRPNDAPGGPPAARRTEAAGQSRPNAR